MGSKVVFLLGAGASKDAGVPIGDEITEILLNYSHYCPSKDGILIENFLRYIQVKIATYRRVSSSEINFEHIIGTIVELSKREDYPIVPLLGEGDSIIEELEKRISLDEVVDKIYALLRELFLTRYPIKYLDKFQDFFDLSKPLDIFTLNYDLSLEEAFSHAKISYTTGYRNRKDMLSVWEPTEFKKEDTLVRIFKLHGSINLAQFYKYSPPPKTKESITDSDIDYFENYPEHVLIESHQVIKIEPPDRTKGMVGIMNFGTRKELLRIKPIQYNFQLFF